MVHELRPAIAWDKGRALRFLLGVLGLEGTDVLPIYVGDDVTDEDGFTAVAGHGIGVVVRGESDERRTSARYALDDPAQTRRFLHGLGRILGGGTP